jgi:Fuc2NAc and GlcNAc transferase
MRGVFFLFAVYFLLSLAGTRLFIGAAKKRNLMDIPNERSSHSTPTPRGGGIVFSSLFLLFVLFRLLFCPGQDSQLLIALLAGGGIVAGTGWIDDTRGLSPKVRLGVHFLAMAIALLVLGGFPSLYLGFATIPLGIFGSLIALVGGVWMINLYNFMDGIDGLAAGEAVIVSFAAAFITLWAGDVETSVLLLMLAAFVGGFLFWNWHPARIFMGDYGSCFLGFVFAVFAIAGERSGMAPALLWAVMLSVFVVDATMTLLGRVRREKNLAIAHREHLYQQAAAPGTSHEKTTAAFLAATVLVCLFAWVFKRVFFAGFVLTFMALILAWSAMYPRLRAREATTEGGKRS